MALEKDESIANTRLISHSNRTVLADHSVNLTPQFLLNEGKSLEYPVENYLRFLVRREDEHRPLERSRGSLGASKEEIGTAGIQIGLTGRL